MLLLSLPELSLHMNWSSTTNLSLSSLKEACQAWIDMWLLSSFGRERLVGLIMDPKSLYAYEDTYLIQGSATETRWRC